MDPNNPNYQPPVPSSTPPPPPPSYPGGAYPPPYAGAQPGGFQTPFAPPPPKKRSRLGLWIGLGVGIAVVVVAAIVIISFVIVANASTPTKTLNAYCDALKKGDYQAAYNQFGSNASKVLTEAQFASIFSSDVFGKVTSCTVSNVSDSAGTGVLNITYVNLGSTVYDFNLGSEGGTWKIIKYQVRSTPTFTLRTFCLALKGQAYQTAYNQLASTLQSQLTEQQFMDSFTSTTSNCQVTANDAAGTGSVTVLRGDGNTVTEDVMLVQESGTWKISAVQTVSTPTATLLDYCTALKGQNYQSAYSLLSSTVQSQLTLAQFTALFPSMVSDCKVSNVNDSAGTGSISFTFANGATGIVDYTLVNEGGSWKINASQLRP